MPQKTKRISKIEEYMLENNVSKKVFCDRCGISIGVLNKILNGKTNITMDSLEKVLKFLKCKFNDIY